MLINNKYNDSLCLILCGDEKNRERILQFINSIPQKVLNKLEESLKYFYGVKRHNISYFYNSDDGFLYGYNINSSDGQLSISRCVKNGIDYDEIFVLNLFPCVDLNNIITFREVSIGAIFYGSMSDLNDADKIEYRLFKTPFGILLKLFREYSVGVRTIFSKFDLLEDINVETNCLIKRKKK